jgi:membrane protein DedA with SNARE-associated domain
MLNYIIDLVTPVGRPGLLIVFFILLACGLGLPLPEDIPIAVTGIMVSDATVLFRQAFFVCLAGVLIGDSIIYWAGRLWGDGLLRNRLVARIIKPQILERSASAFSRYGNKIIFGARFMPGLRTPTFFFVGMVKKPYWLFLLIDGTAAVISVPVWIYVGKVFGENLPVLEKMLRQFKLGTFLVVLFLVLLFIFGNTLKKRIAKALNSKLS